LVLFARDWREIAVEGKRVLLVEDEVLIRLFVAESLSDAGFEVIEAGDGDQAMELLAALDRVDLLLTDIQLPSWADGNAVAAEAKRRCPGLPVIYATARPDSLKNKIADCDALVRKPYGPAEVLAVIRRLLGGA
jgi:DNA-binding response OmpR family regulator